MNYEKESKLIGLDWIGLDYFESGGKSVIPASDCAHRKGLPFLVTSNTSFLL
jgi:hypothetical protein